MSPKTSKDQIENQPVAKKARDNGLYVAAILLFIVKLILRSRCLSWWDSAQFALALERYNVVEHRPHPPGYPLYILWGKIVSWFTHDPNLSFILFGLLLSTIAAILIKKLAEELSGKSSVGWIAFALYACAPLTIYHELKALTYIVSAFFSVWLAWEAFRIVTDKETKPWKISIALGLMGMIRPYESILLIPFAVWAVYRLGLRKFLYASLIYIVCQIAWLIPVAQLSGGWGAYFSELASEGLKHQRNFGILMGKPLAKTVKNWRAIYYSLRQSFPVWSFLAIIPLFTGLIKPSGKSLRKIFFLLWIGPALVLYSINYVNYAGIPLYIIPAISVLIAYGVNWIASLVGNLRLRIGKTYLSQDEINRLIAIVIALHLLIIFFSIDVGSKYVGERYRKYDPDGFNYHRMLAGDGYVFMIKMGVDKLSEHLGDPDKVLLMSDLNYRVIMYYLPDHKVLWTRYLCQQKWGDGSTKLGFNHDDETIQLTSAEWNGENYWVYELKNDEKSAVFTDEMLNNVDQNAQIRILPEVEASKAFVVDISNAWGLYFRFGKFGVISMDTAKDMGLVSDSNH